MQYIDRAPRVPLEGDATVHLGGEQIPCSTLNLSTSGIALRSPVRRRVGGQVRVEFRISQILWVAVSAMLVRSSRRKGGGYTWGVKFLEVDKWVQEYLEGFVDDNLTEATAIAAC
jgi:hypothetical protein